ncbi:hypothetical protein C8R43DRAFT_887823, partial [Mycena crocata]
LLIWLQNAGYNTYYAGKLMNSHFIETYNNPAVQGSNSSSCVCSRASLDHDSPMSSFLLDPNMYNYCTNPTVGSLRVTRHQHSSLDNKFTLINTINNFLKRQSGKRRSDF